MKLYGVERVEIWIEGYGLRGSGGLMGMDMGRYVKLETKTKKQVMRRRSSWF